MLAQDNLLWLQSWREARIDFHQQAVNLLLIRFWPILNLAAGSRVLVPLCGKSLDMLWLAEQGYQVIGVELSPIAVRDFFRENHLKPVKRRIGKLTRWQAGRIIIYCGDYFALPKEELGSIDMVYDRAALTALPESIRQAYVAKMGELIDAHADVLLLTTEDAEAHESMQQAMGVAEEVSQLYGTGYAVKLLHVESVFETNPESPAAMPLRVEYKVYHLQPEP